MRGLTASHTDYPLPGHPRMAPSRRNDMPRTRDMVTTQEQTVGAVLGRMQDRIDALPADLAHRRIFASTYLRTTQAVGAAIDDALFEDPEWVERWDVAFADLFLDAHDADRQGRVQGVPRPWRLAF